MKRLVPVSLCITFCLAFAVNAYSQCNNENKLWQDIEEQRNLQEKSKLLDSFIRSCSSSGHRPDADKQLVAFWVSNKDNKKIMDHADAFQQSLPSADPASKAAIYSQAMVSAATINNLPKTVEFGGLALRFDPNNFMVLTFLASSGIIEPAKMLEYAEKAVTLPKPATMTDAQYQTNMGRMEGVLGLNLLSQQKYKEALPHYEKAIKLNPKDHANQFRHGFATMNLMPAAVQEATNANDDLIRAMTKEPKVQADIDKAQARVQAASDEALKLRDIAMDSFAKAFAIGGQFAAQAKQLLDSLYTNKNKNLDGIDQYVATKKTEVGL
jgi:tetratricopeptide (TPR) repeat protein